MKVVRHVLQKRSLNQSASRRRIVHILLGFFAIPGLAIAQSSTVVRRIGLLDIGTPDTPEEMWKEGAPLRELGWVEGQNLHVERRYANNRPEALQALAEELVRARVEVIWTRGTPATLEAKRATTTIPIVFSSAGDPVLLGLVASLARPGGNVTGYSVAGPEVETKELALLKELLPGLRRIGVLETSTNPYFRAARDQFERACRLLAIAPVFVEIVSEDEINNAVAQLARQGVQALVLRGDTLLNDHRVEVTGAALKHALPTMAEQSSFVREGSALISYSPISAEQDRRSASLVDRILRGAKPADLPVEQPQRFELVINLKTARALGLTVPQSLLLRADEVVR